MPQAALPERNQWSAHTSFFPPMITQPYSISQLSKLRDAALASILKAGNVTLCWYLPVANRLRGTECPRASASVMDERLRRVQTWLALLVPRHIVVRPSTHKFCRNFRKDSESFAQVGTIVVQ